MANYTVRVHATVQDWRGAKAAVVGRINAPDTASLADLETATAAWAAKLAAVTVATVIEWGISAVLNITPLSANANFLLNTLQQTAVFDYREVSGALHGAVAVPAYDSTLLGGDKNPDNTATPVAAWIAGNTGTVAGGHWAGPNGINLAALDYSFWTSRKHRRPSQRGE